MVGIDDDLCCPPMNAKHLRNAWSLCEQPAQTRADPVPLQAIAAGVRNTRPNIACVATYSSREIQLFVEVDRDGRLGTPPRDDPVPRNASVAGSGPRKKAVIGNARSPNSTEICMIAGGKEASSVAGSALRKKAVISNARSPNSTEICMTAGGKEASALSTVVLGVSSRGTLNGHLSWLL
jgi:hypothetical protein